MLSHCRCFVLLCTASFLTGIAAAQDPFTWTHTSLGGGGFCLEVRFAPQGFFGKPNGQILYLATDVSGVYRSNAMDVNGEVITWSRLIDPNPPNNEPDVLHPYTTTVAFTRNFNFTEQDRLIVGTQEGIYIWNEANQTWRAPQTQPDRNSLAAAGRSMDSKDGRYPWIGVIRQCPPNTRYLTAGLGDIRNYKYGLSTVLRSSDGGNNWQIMPIPFPSIAVTATEEVHDLDFIVAPNSQNETLDYTFITTNFGIYLMWDSIATNKINFKRISPDTSIATNWRGLVVLGEAVGAVQASGQDDLLLFASRCVPYNSAKVNVQEPAVFKLSTSLQTLLSPSFNANQTWSAENSVDGNNGVWQKDFGKIAADPRTSRIDSFQVFVGKPNSPGLFVRNETDAKWYIAYHKPQINLIDRGYRADSTEMTFGHFDFNPNDSFKNPCLYACWRDGAFFSKGNDNMPYKQMRKVQQMFTSDTLSSTGIPPRVLGADGDYYFQKRGDFDEVYFVGCPPVFHPANPNIIMVGCPDNGILRTVNAGQEWSMRRLRDKYNAWKPDYGTTRQTVFHIAYHPKNYNLVLASAGPFETPPPRGELLKNTIGGVGGESSWSKIAGSPSALKNLPNAEVRGFVFDTKPGLDSTGVFAAVYRYGIYYGKIASDGTVTSFQEITDTTLTNKIPPNSNPTSGSSWLTFTRIQFDPSNPDILYVSRGKPAGGVFRLRLKTNRASLNVNDCIQQVDEIVFGAFVQAGRSDRAAKKPTGDVINLLVTATEVFTGVSPNTYLLNGQVYPYPGGLVRWKKTTNLPIPADSANAWVIGGLEKNGGVANTTSCIGGLAEDPGDHSIYACTYRFTLPEDNFSDDISTNWKLAGESNYKFMNLWRSTNNGVSFSPVASSGMKFPIAASMAFFSNESGKLKLFVPTKGNGIWIGERSYSNPKNAAAPDSAATDKNLPKRFALHQNYPNPFNPSTMIKYDLPKVTEIKIIIFDVLGRKVRTLVDTKEKAGYYSKVWDGKGDDGVAAASGIYFYRIHTPEFSRVRKAMLLR